MPTAKNIFDQLKFVNLTNVNPQAIHKVYHIYYNVTLGGENNYFSRN